jgi:hypothetical protein
MFGRIVPLATVLVLAATASSTACGSRVAGDKAKPSASPSAKVPSGEELKKGLLVLSDMPAGYSASTPEVSTPEPADTTSVAAGTAECGQLFNEFGKASSLVKQGVASVEFEKSRTGPFVRHSLESYRDRNALQHDMDQIREAVDKCGEFTTKDSDGEARVKIATASFPKLGDDTAAFKLEATVSSGTRKIVIGGYLVAVRIANVVSTITTFGVPSSDAAETEQIARKAADKLGPIAR